MALVVIDSLGEALSSDGINANDDGEVADWGRNIARPAAHTGAAVLLLDHLPKAAENALTPMGSQRKQAAVDGATYSAQIVRAPKKGHAGHVRLVCGKDRQGTYSRGQVVAELHLVPDGDRTRVELREPEAVSLSADGGWRPTYLMEAVSKWLIGNPAATQNGVIQGVSGKQAAKVRALDGARG